VLAQHTNDLLFREPLPLHLSVLQSRPDSNSKWRKNSVAGHTLWRLEHKEQFQVERTAFYRMIDDMWKSGQMDERRMHELMDQYEKFGNFMKG
jgi:hypothetical protein